MATMNIDKIIFWPMTQLLWETGIKFWSLHPCVTAMSLAKRFEFPVMTSLAVTESFLCTNFMDNSPTALTLSPSNESTIEIFLNFGRLTADQNRHATWRWRQCLSPSGCARPAQGGCHLNGIVGISPHLCSSLVISGYISLLLCLELDLPFLFLLSSHFPSLWFGFSLLNGPWGLSSTFHSVTVFSYFWYTQLLH